ncbi:MAG TPA: hypothetical protein PKI61_01025 [bacterium]|nr:hypothetical protein [bacterium]HPT29334.1 hypothetical protein [bacterium]
MKASKYQRVALISNCIDEGHHKAITDALGLPSAAGFKPMRYEFLGQEGIIIPLDFIASDLLAPTTGSRTDAIVKAKEKFVAAVKFAVSAHAVNTVLLAASTKRLFGDGKELKSLFPDVDFTIGDNGTLISFCSLVGYLVELYNLKKDDQIVIGGLGHLGKGIYFHLKSQGFNNMILVSQFNFREDKAARVVKSYDQIPDGKTKLFLACAHTNPISRADILRIKAKKMAMIDVAVPHGIKANIIAGVEGVQRFDGGDYFLPRLICHFHPLLMGLQNQGDFYGCFLEATMIAFAKSGGNCDFRNLDLFQINATNLAAVKTLFELYHREIFIPISSFSQSIVGLPRSIEI